MNLIASRIFGGVHVGTDDWTAHRAIITSIASNYPEFLVSCMNNMTLSYTFIRLRIGYFPYESS